MATNNSVGKVSLVHNFIVALLILASLIFCFMPLAKLDMSQGSAEEIRNIMHEVDGDDIYEALGDMNVTVEVTPIRIIECTAFLPKLIVAGINAAKGEVDEATKADLKSTFLNPDGTIKENMKQPALLSAALAATLISDLKIGDTDSLQNNMFAFIVKIIASVFAITYMVIFALIMPLVYLILFIVTLVQLFKYGSDPQKAEDKISGKLLGAVALPLLFFLFPCVTPNITYGMGVLLILGAAALSALVNLIFSRMRSYTPSLTRKANVLQCFTVLSIAGYVLFFMNVIKTGIFRTFVHGPWSTYSAEVMDAGKNVGFDYYLDAILILLSALFVILSTAYVAKMLKRFSFSASYRNTESSGASLFTSIITLVAVALPFVVTFLTHASVDGVDKISFLVLEDAQKSALTLALVGLGIALVSEILILIFNGLAPYVEQPANSGKAE